VTDLDPATALKLAEVCAGGQGHTAHLAANDECPWCGVHSDMTGEEAQAILTGRVQSDEDAVQASENLAELMRNAGVIELPDGSGWYGSAWERHDDPEQTP
jgi:hypothetical protein